MKSYILNFVAALALFFSCNNQPENPGTSPNDFNSSIYNGPIIDMHIHAFHEGNPMLGRNHPPTLRGVTYQGASTADELRELTFAKFKKHNIVKAVVTHSWGWVEEAPEIVLSGNARGSIDQLRKQYNEGNLQVIAEMAPFLSRTHC